MNFKNTIVLIITVPLLEAWSSNRYFVQSFVPTTTTRRIVSSSRLYCVRSSDGSLEYMLEPSFRRPENENALYNAGLLILQSSNRKDENRALPFFLAAIEFNPMRDGTNFNIALIKDNQGDYVEAINYYEKTIKCTKNSQLSTAAYNNLVGLLMRLGLLEEAAKTCNRAIENDPKDANAWTNLGIIMRDEQKMDLSKQCFEHALLLADGYNAVALNNLGTFAMEQQNIPTAEEYFKKACEIDPTDESSMYSLACILKEKGNIVGAATLLEEIVNLNPNHSQAPLMLASLMGDVPDKASPNYVADLFDYYSVNGYQEHMVNTLQYQVPALIKNALIKSINDSNSSDILSKRLQDGQVIDLGMGTGLCAAELKSSLCTNAILKGCDLSSQMCSQAETTGLYEELFIGDCVDYLSKQLPDSLDLIIAGDVLVYIGDLLPLFQKVYSTLAPRGGLFAFTVESLDDCALIEDDAQRQEAEQKGYTLHSSLRYAHSRAYIMRLGGDTSLRVLNMEKAVLRTQDNLPVYGYVVVIGRD